MLAAELGLSGIHGITREPSQVARVVAFCKKKLAHEDWNEYRSMFDGVEAIRFLPIYMR